MKGEELTEMVELREAGALGFTDDGYADRQRPDDAAAPSSTSASAGGEIALHEEDPTLSERGRHARGRRSRPRLGLGGIPSVSRVDHDRPRRRPRRATRTARIHVQHLSAAESVEIDPRRQGAGRPRSAPRAGRTTLSLTDEEVHSLDPPASR